jgi:hypothetical protein
VITFPFPPGATLVAFTDGLVERRGASLDAGLAVLKNAAVQRASGPDELIELLVDASDVVDHEDDIAILAVEMVATEQGGADPSDGRTDEPAGGPLAQEANAYPVGDCSTPHLIEAHDDGSITKR